ncbi:hypothetical protein QCN29_32220 [Streptomyces sp. HNM0663]|uniref:Uncharacterized protein n=1 Tax=Streptomyces chengmaiensis TaxID=3040919 RepID=A0ABT6HXL8_9ACTN|nr:hypothetical protein [Streptomyces chengmaiensis]MDH2393350.1 hypothetical protein [Streptomyces chengmaiensis]
MTPAPPEAVATDPVALWASAQATALGTGDAPAYGTPAWSALPAADPRRTVAILTAAEQWRRHTAREAWLDHLADTDPDEWFRIVTVDANAHARTIAGGLARRPTVAELDARRRASPAQARPVTATPRWPPVAIPGRPGWVRTLTPDGRQLDRPRNHPQEPPRDLAPPHYLRPAGRAAAA